ncbi:MAG TPA: H-type small acid-soluble spore protein [Candidatus Nitrosocosmicus sp.]|nr:H-type small acid-soluble spore protein [Candidatus Nitrosocosmicus sp.]
MDINRAEEIINSKGVIEVTYNNSPVWIENVIREDATAQVRLLTNNQSLNIPVESLNEKDQTTTF